MPDTKGCSRLEALRCVVAVVSGKTAQPLSEFDFIISQRVTGCAGSERRMERCVWKPGEAVEAKQSFCSCNVRLIV